MTEAPQEYITDALEMMGQGYEQPAAIIDPSRMVKALRDGGIVDYKVWGWVKTSARFRSHIKILRGAKHDIWHYLALGVGEDGRCKETIKQICEGTGYSHTEVINSLKELDELGYLSIQKDSKGNIYTPEFVARGGNSPTESAVKKVESTPVYQVESTPSEVKSVSTYKELKELIQKEIKMHNNLSVWEAAENIYQICKNEGVAISKKQKTAIREWLASIEDDGEEKTPAKTTKKKEDKVNIDIKTMARGRGVSEPMIEFIDRACKAFGFSIMQLDEVSLVAYGWIMEQEASGRTIEKFADWAREDEMGKFIGKYRNSGGSIKNDWARAFPELHSGTEYI